MAKRPSVQEILAAARAGEPVLPEPGPSATTEAGPASTPPAPIPPEPGGTSAPPSAAGPAGQGLTLQQKLAAARSATPGSPTASPKPRPTAEATPQPPSGPSSKPLTARDKLAAARSSKPVPPAGAPGPPPAPVASGPALTAKDKLAAARSVQPPVALARPAPPAKSPATKPPLVKAGGPAPDPEPTPTAATPSRRSFLSLPQLVAGYAALAAVAGVAWSWLRRTPPAGANEAARTIAIGRASDFRPGAVDERWVDDGGFWVVREAVAGQDQLFALRATCTHLGCRPRWQAADRAFLCPCHGSRFAPDGTPTAGPAPRPLDRYPIALGDDGQVQVTTGRPLQADSGPGSDPARSLTL